MTENNSISLFLDNQYYRTTTTGVNIYTKIKKRSESEIKLQAATYLIESLKSQLTNNNINKKKKRITYTKDFGVVKDCVDNLKENITGYVFNLQQLSDVVLYYGFEFNLTIDDCGVYCLRPVQPPPQICLSCDNY